MKSLERERARILRKDGLSMHEIAKRLEVSKASVSLWVRDVSLSEKQKKGLSENGRSIESVERRRASRLANEATKRNAIVLHAKKDFSKLSARELKLIGCMLYLGEGGKTNRGIVRLANSDPDVIRIMMRFFREVCNVPEHKFRGYVHTFEHANVEKTEKYWSQVSGIPRGQFYKTFTKPSALSLQKRNTLPMGTFDIYVCDTKLFLKISGWMEKIKELLLS